jgi:hypothetical protein
MVLSFIIFRALKIKDKRQKIKEAQQHKGTTVQWKKEGERGRQGRLVSHSIPPGYYAICLIK